VRWQEERHCCDKPNNNGPLLPDLKVGFSNEGAGVGSPGGDPFKTKRDGAVRKRALVSALLELNAALLLNAGLFNRSHLAFELGQFCRGWATPLNVKSQA
jgi:hypothetical protein